MKRKNHNNFEEEEKEDEKCPYLDTINRRVLDFDFEKVCSVCVSNLNVYVCLVCGKYYQGRSSSSYAFLHSVDFNHHMWMNLANAKIYCLPDDYEVKEASLADIKYLLNPTFSLDHVNNLDASSASSSTIVSTTSNQDISVRCLDGTEYLPGLVGLNNLKQTDYLNVVVQLLNRIIPIRNFFLLHSSSSSSSSSSLTTKESNSGNNNNNNNNNSPYNVSARFSELLRKLWNPRNFKNHVSPHELMQVVVAASKRFAIGTKSDPVDLFVWMCNTMHRELAKTSPSSIIFDSLQGEIKITTTDDKQNEKSERKNFLLLTLQLPQVALFRDKMEKTTISQVSLFQLMKKFDGVTTELTPEGHHRIYTITKLPKYLVLHYKRFTRNDFFLEKNRTIVNFPQRNFNLAPYVSDLPNNSKTMYDLVATVVHQGELNNQGHFRTIIHRKSSDKLYECNDLHITELKPEQLALSEAYIQVFELQQ